MSNIIYVDGVPIGIPGNNNFSNSLNEESIFYTLFDISNKDISTNAKEYTHKVLFFDSGIDVIEAYQKTTPAARQILIFYEKETKDKNNLFGTVCRVKMGSERKKLMQQLLRGGKRYVSVNNDTTESTTLKQWVQRIATHNKGIEASNLLSAIKLELSGILNENNWLKKLFGFNNTIADWLRNGVETMEGWKFTEENYEFSRVEQNGKVDPNFNPLLPIPYEVFNRKNYSKDEETVSNNGLVVLKNHINNFEQILLLTPEMLATMTQNKVDDVLVFALREYLKEHLPRPIQEVLLKVKAVLQQAQELIDTVIKEAVDNLLMLNAFLCGLINGLVSLLQTVVLLLAYIIDNMPLFELEKPFDRGALDGLIQKLELVEDVIDMITDNVKDLFNGMLKILDTLPFDLINFFKKIYNNYKDKSQYFWAYLLGAFVFEVLVELILAFVTGGTSALGSAASKISRVAAQANKAGIKIAQQASKVIVSTTTDLIKFLKMEFKELIEAVKSGKLVAYIKRKFFEFLGQGDNVIAKSFTELMSIAIKANKDNFYTASALRRFINEAQRLNLSIEDFEGFIKVGTIKKIRINSLTNQMDNYINIVLKRGYPFKFKSLMEFKRFSKDLLTELKKIEIPIDDVRIQGSVLRKNHPKPKDLDLAVFVDDIIFDNYLRDAFKNKVKLDGEIVDITSMSNDEMFKLADNILTGDRNRTNATSRTFARAMQSGKISALSKPRIISQGHRDIINKLNEKYPNLNIEDISVQKRGGKLELKPDLKIK